MAGTTATYALPYPTGTDLITQGDNTIAALAQKVEDTIKGPRNDDYSFTTSVTVTSGTTFNSRTVTYPVAFSAAPAVVACVATTADSPGWFATVTLVTATTCKLRVDKLVGAAPGSNVTIEVAFTVRPSRGVVA